MDRSTKGLRACLSAKSRNFSEEKCVYASMRLYADEVAAAGNAIALAGNP
jgi:hypothetical protein